MTHDFATAMRRSLELTRAGNPQEATRVIQQQLSGDGNGIPSRRARSPLAKLMKKPVTSRSNDAPSGMESRHHNGAFGSRNFELFVPSCDPSQLRGLVVMLHGCTQNPADFARGTQMNALGETERFIIAYPEQPRQANANGCWNWFLPEHQHGTRGEAGLLAELATALQAEFAIGPRQTFVAGLSAGGAMAAILGHTRPDIFAAVGVHSGLPTGAAQDMMGAFAAMRGDGDIGAPVDCPAIVLHGLADPTVAPINAGRLIGTMLHPDRRRETVNGRTCRIEVGETAAGHMSELWLIEGAGHAWSGGNVQGSHTDRTGPNASAEMTRFFTTCMERDT